MVTRRIRVAVLSTGTELRAPGESLVEGAIYDSNRPMLLALIDHPAVDAVDMGIVPDEPKALVAALREAGASFDLVLTSGGVSVGEEDYVRSAVEAAGGTIAPLRIAIKPGKPLAIGRMGKAMVLGLPGNPLAALVGFLVIGRAVIARMAGAPPRTIEPTQARAGFTRNIKPGRTEFAPAHVVDWNDVGHPIVEALGKGGSARLLPLCMADGFCVLPPNVSRVNVGDPVGYLPMLNLGLLA